MERITQAISLATKTGTEVETVGTISLSGKTRQALVVGCVITPAPRETLEETAKVDLTRRVNSSFFLEGKEASPLFPL
jgi:hypothetical protein